MIMNWFKKFVEKKDEYDLSFKSINGNYAFATPVVASSRIKSQWMLNQPSEHSFSKCPGIFDFSTAGYLITAPFDIEIKANNSGIAIRTSCTDRNYNTYTHFDKRMVIDMPAAHVEGVPFAAGKIPLPWTVSSKPGISCYVLPPFMHVDFLDKLFVYPGVIDTDSFRTINFLFTVKKPCEFIIVAGTPILQVLPFKRRTFHAVCDRATQREQEEHELQYPSRMKNYYRKYLYKKKEYNMTSPYDHRDTRVIASLREKQGI